MCDVTIALRRAHLEKSSHCCVIVSSVRRRLETSEGAADARSLIASGDEGSRDIVLRKLMKNAARSRLLSSAAVLDSSMSLKTSAKLWGEEPCMGLWGKG